MHANSNRSMKRVALVWGFSVLFVLSASGGNSNAADEEAERLRSAINDKHAEGAELWIYNDLEKAFAAARRQNKPIFVTFRCVPCKACAAFDASVAQGNEVIEELARERFISVRQVEMKGVDLSLFQFDYDLNWAAMFINADGVVYARYGTQSAAGPDAYNSIAGLEKTMHRVLKLHEAYPRNMAELKGKRGEQRPYKTALEMPALDEREKRRGPTTRQNCIHCHNIHDAEQLHAQQTGVFTHDVLWRYPLPENIGLLIDPKDGTRVLSVEADSPAARSGLKVGEEITHVGGQAVTSIADIQWVLHNLPNRDTEVEVRGGKSGTHALKLEAGWKKTDISWRGSMWSLKPRFGVWTPELTAEERRQRGLSEEQSAYIVKWINGNSPSGRAARSAGLQGNDVIVAVDGKALKMSPQHFNVYLKLNYKVGDELPLTVLRGGQRREIRIKLVD